MTSPRRALAEALVSVLPPEWDVRADLRPVDAITAPTVTVWTRDVAPGPTRGLRTYSLGVTLLSPVTDPAEVDDSLDDLLPTLLTAIEHLDPVTWTAAERGVWDSSHHSYSLTVSVPARKDA